MINVQYTAVSPGEPYEFFVGGGQQLPHSWHDDPFLREMKNESAVNGLLTMCSPYDEEAVEQAVEHGFDFVGLESYQMTDWPLLEKIARINLPVVLSVDRREETELARVGTFLNNRHIDCSFLRELYRAERIHGPNPPSGREFDLRFLINERVEGCTGTFSRLMQQVFSGGGGKTICEVTVDLRTVEFGYLAEQLEHLMSGAGYLMCGVTLSSQANLSTFKRGVYVRHALPRGTRLDADNTFCALSRSETQLLAEDLSKYLVHTLRDDLDAGVPVDKSVVISRDIRDRGEFPVFEHLKYSETAIAGVMCLKYSNPSCRRKRVILHLHGGGYVTGSPQEARFSMIHLAEHASFDILSVGYRLAPQYPFPAALEDLLAVYRSLLAEGLPSCSVGFYGESAGGGLVLAATLMLRDRGEPLPAALVCSSPWVDLTNSGDSHSDEMNALDITLKTLVLNENARAYAGRESLENPYISPCYGDFTGLPPLLIYAGEREVLAGDAVRVAKQAEQDGVDVHLRVVVRMPHVFTSLTGVFAESDAAVREIQLFFESHLKEIGEPYPPNNKMFKG